MVILKAIWSCAQLYTPAIVVMKTELLALLLNVMEEGNNGSNRHTGYKKVTLSFFFKCCAVDLIYANLDFEKLLMRFILKKTEISKLAWS